MSNLRNSGTPWLPALDPASRRIVGLFAFRLGLLSLFAFAPFMGGAEPFRMAAHFLALACACCGFVTMVLATTGREPLGFGCLNRWDEALAFVAASRLVDLLLRLAA